MAHTMEELTNTVLEKATLYLSETDTEIEKFPLSIVDFVIEYAIENCHFPSDYTDEKIASILWKYKVGNSSTIILTGTFLP